jgi:hypothetical protein
VRLRLATREQFRERLAHVCPHTGLRHVPTTIEQTVLPRGDGAPGTVPPSCCGRHDPATGLCNPASGE